MSPLRQFTSLFTSTQSGVGRASIILAVTALLSNVLGLVRNLVFYRLIPPAQLDIYYASFRLPDLLFNVLILGAISSAFVPLFSGMLAQDKEKEAKQFTDQTFSWLTVVFGLFAIVLIALAEPLMRLVVHGFDPARFSTAVLLTRILMVQSVFFAWSYTCGGYLNSNRRFSTPALAPLIYNLAIIVGAFIGSRYGITAIVYSVVVGAMLHFAIQGWEVWRTGYRPKWDLRITKEIRELGVLMLPRSVSQGMNQFVLIVFTSLASALTSGSIAILSGMNDLQTTPTVIVVNSLAVALFPTLAARISTSNWDEANRLIQKSFRLTLFFMIPSIVIGYILRAQIVRLYFSIGGANWELTNLAIDTFIAYLVGIIPTAFVVLLSRVFFAMRDTRTPMILSVIAGVVGVTWATISINLFHGNVAQLALADSIVSVVQCGLYLFALKRHAEVRLGLINLIPKLIQYALGAFLAGFAAWLTLQFVDVFFVVNNVPGTRTILGLAGQFMAGLLVGGGVIVAYSKAVFKEEITWLKQRKEATNL